MKEPITIDQLRASKRITEQGIELQESIIKFTRGLINGLKQRMYGHHFTEKLEGRLITETETLNFLCNHRTIQKEAILNRIK